MRAESVYDLRLKWIFVSGLRNKISEWFFPSRIFFLCRFYFNFYLLCSVSIVSNTKSRRAAIKVFNVAVARSTERAKGKRTSSSKKKNWNLVRAGSAKFPFDTRTMVDVRSWNICTNGWRKVNAQTRNIIT